MRFQRVIRYLLTLYLWGFIAYQLLPVKVIPSVNYAPRELYPQPVIYSYAFAYDVKTAFSNNAGSLKNLMRVMERRGIDVVFGDFPESIGNRLFPTRDVEGCRVIRSSEISFWEDALHLIFERIPKLITGGVPESIFSRRIYDTPSKCYLLAHDKRVLFTTFFGLELPTYEGILSGGKNIYLSKDVLLREPYSEDFFRKAIVLFGGEKVRALAYSDRSFYLPGRSTVYSFRYVVDTDVKNSLIVLFHNGRLKGIYEQRRINVPVWERGDYVAHVLTYKFKVNIFYFGLRSVALISSIRLM